MTKAAGVECFVCWELVSMRDDRADDRVQSDEGWAHRRCVDESLMSPDELLLRRIFKPNTSAGCAYCGLPIPLRERRATEAGWVHEGCTGRSLRSPGALGGEHGGQPDERIVHAVFPDGSELVRYEQTGWWRERLGADSRPEKLTVGAAVHLAVTEQARLSTGQPGGQAFMRRMRALGWRPGD